MALEKSYLSFVHNEIESLGYEVSYECTNKNKPDQVQQMYVYKNGKRIARVSLILACRISMMENGVGKNEKELLRILTMLSMSL